MDEREQRIRQRAYELWEKAGRPEGSAEQHWSEAQATIDREASNGGGGTQEHDAENAAERVSPEAQKEAEADLETFYDKRRSR